MKPCLSFVIALLLGVISHGAEKKVIAAEPGSVPGKPVDPTEKTIDPNQRQAVTEFTGDDIAVVLRTLARQAKMNVVVSLRVQGTVTMRLENQTPKEAFFVIAQAEGLIVDEAKGIYFVRHPDDALVSKAKITAHETKLLFDALIAEKFSREEAMQLVMHLQKIEKPAVEKPARTRN